PDFSRGKINARLGSAPEGNSPRPSSQHGQVVNVIYADGSGKSLAQNIDESVYARLVSSNGNNGNQQILSGY
ncbi:MAG: prepilin-type cleavage/methylation domain-containing protein, partial [Planctomycetaceae bacterium]|nr:prepilin-type cleavage/methylation domain-containing protein [Planctomycetaceae bacterium]